jgi:erythromycin esterase-like protein
MKFNSLSYIESDFIADIVKDVAYSLDAPETLDALMEKIGDARIVMLGEASHGTHEYYIWRARLSKRLIEEKGFNFIAVEGDWPDCYRVNRYVKNLSGSGSSAPEVLQCFNRWPTWMWANWEIVSLVEWMHKHNRNKPLNERAGFYGLDVYSLWESLDELKKYLVHKDPETYQVAENAFKCFEPYSPEGQAYARASYRSPISCEDEVIDLLSEVRRKMPLYNTDPEAVFNAEQNAMVTADAEKYYRTMVRGNALSWNVRDQHMYDTLDRLLKFHGKGAKAIVWEHNTHIGDARATDMREEEMFNIGELARKGYGDKDTFLIGFGSFSGEVVAARKWSGEMQRMPLPAAEKNSWEDILHKTGIDNMLLLSDDLAGISPFRSPVKHRAVGVVYHPELERMGNYVPSVIPERYDAFMYIDKTKGVHPLHIKPDGGQMPETYPWGV